MGEWKLQLRRDVLRERDLHFSSLRDRIDTYRSFYAAPGEEQAADGSASLPEAGAAAVDVHTTSSDFSCMLGLYESSGSECTFSRYGWRSRSRQVPSAGSFHRHDFIEILYVAEGSFSQILLGKKETFHEGEFVITDRRIEHADYFDGTRSAVLFLWLQPGYLNRLLSSFGGADSLQEFFFRILQKTWTSQSYIRLTPGIQSRRSDLELQEAMEILVREDERDVPGKQQLMEGCLLRILYLLSLSYSMQLHSSDKESREDILFFELDRYLRGHLQTASTAELEKVFHYHRNYYNKLTQKYRQCSLISYLQQLRMERAAVLLKTTALPVKEIAFLCGYSNTSHFYHLFENTYGISPAVYREKAQAGLHGS